MECVFGRRHAIQTIRSAEIQLTRLEPAMRLAKCLINSVPTPALIDQDAVYPLNVATLSEVLFADDPQAAALAAKSDVATPLADVTLLAPVDNQDVWAAGVTYKRSMVARMEESEAAASHYDKVYEADRPELFFKSSPARVVNPGEPVRVRADSAWSVPEPELTLAISPTGKIVGYTVGNDMSARDIEGDNPLYLPQAKTYNQACALGPWIWLTDDPLPTSRIDLEIRRDDKVVSKDNTSTDQIHRKLEDLVDWLFKEMDFPHGAFLLTGTGIIPEDNFSLEDGDHVTITIENVGTLANPVVKG